MTELYDFTGFVRSDVYPLILAINTIGKDLVGAEIGVERGNSFFTILHNCEIKKLYGIDSWQPYRDFLAGGDDTSEWRDVDQKMSDLNKLIFKHHLKHHLFYAKNSLKIEIIEKDTLDAVNDIADKSLDFIFFDAMMTEKQTYDEARAYYPKIKKGGLFTGHDSGCKNQVMRPIRKIKDYYNNKNPIIDYSNCFLFRV